LKKWTIRAASPEDALRVAMAYDLAAQPRALPTLRRAAIEHHVLGPASRQALALYQQGLQDLVIP